AECEHLALAPWHEDVVHAEGPRDPFDGGDGATEARHGIEPLALEQRPLLRHYRDDEHGVVRAPAGLMLVKGGKPDPVAREEGAGGEVRLEEGDAGTDGDAEGREHDARQELMAQQELRERAEPGRDDGAHGMTARGGRG